MISRIGLTTISSGGAHSFIVPARKGYYYLLVEGDTPEEVVPNLQEAISKLREVRGGPSHLTSFSNIDQVVIDPAFKKRFKEFGFAHRYIRKKLPPQSERKGYIGFLPE